jgi:hypothetical protein
MYTTNYPNIKERFEQIQQIDEIVKWAKEAFKAEKIELVGRGANRGTSHVYEVKLHDIKIDDDELITRCDNRTFDMSYRAGSVQHFGGYVRKTGCGITEVTVYVD